MSDRPAVEERAVRLEVNGRAVHAWTASPGHADALAAGRLLADGYIDARSELLELHVEERDGVTVVRARVRPERAVAARKASGLAEGDATRPARAEATNRPPLPSVDAFPALFREMFAAAELYQEVGGLHSAALSDGQRLLHLVEEIGRHNAVDKVIGRALLAGDDLSRLGLLVSARISGAMARKGARARLAWLASRSVPTTMAVSIAATAGIPLVARAPGRNPYVFLP